VSPRWSASRTGFRLRLGWPTLASMPTAAGIALQGGRLAEPLAEMMGAFGEGRPEHASCAARGGACLQIVPPEMTINRAVYDPAAGRCAWNRSTRQLRGVSVSVSAMFTMRAAAVPGRFDLVPIGGPATALVLPSRRWGGRRRGGAGGADSTGRSPSPAWLAVSLPVDTVTTGARRGRVSSARCRRPVDWCHWPRPAGGRRGARRRCSPTCPPTTRGTTVEGR
jgi:hypothetical protein